MANGKLWLAHSDSKFKCRMQIHRRPGPRTTFPTFWRCVDTGSEFIEILHLSHSPPPTVWRECLTALFNMFGRVYVPLFIDLSPWTAMTLKFHYRWHVGGGYGRIIIWSDNRIFPVNLGSNWINRIDGDVVRPWVAGCRFSSITRHSSGLQIRIRQIFSFVLGAD